MPWKLKEIALSTITVGALLRCGWPQEMFLGYKIKTGPKPHVNYFPKLVANPKYSSPRRNTAIGVILQTSFRSSTSPDGIVWFVLRFFQLYFPDLRLHLVDYIGQNAESPNDQRAWVLVCAEKLFWRSVISQRCEGFILLGPLCW